MKRFLTMAVAAILLASAAFAQGPISTLNANSKWSLQPNATFPGGLPGSGPFSTNNDDTCDIAVAPAATLLLPNFEVDVLADRTVARDTLFSITNVSNVPAIAHITVWTDRSFPVIDFNIFLTGYDVVSLSLYDLIVRGQIPPTSMAPVATHGPRSLNNDLNPGFVAGALAACTALPGPIPGANGDGSPAIPPTAGTLLADMQNALTVGTYGGIAGVGNSHPGIAVGYVTADVANTCSTTLPTRRGYYTTEILYDNQLIGEYIRVNPSVASGNYAGGNPLVHIRAVPEGGLAGSGLGLTNLPYTFYDRYTDHTTPGLTKADRRQPLPGVFAARYITGTPLNFGTDFAIWREGLVGGQDNETAAVGVIPGNVRIPLREFVRFDESENPTTTAGGTCQISPCPPGVTIFLPETSTPSVNEAVFPPDFPGTTDAGGWVYMNLNNGGSVAYAGVRQAGGTHVGVSQNWVNVRMTSESRYGVDFDAAFMGAGCSADPGITTVGIGNPIRPGANLTP